MSKLNCCILVAAFFFSCFLPSIAQDHKRAQNWYFGDSAGLSFATDPPTALTDGAMYALEGCATISDTAGNLLFYTNGLTVWNRDHQVMKNGIGLFGYESSSQPAVIVPQPENDSIYFVFTTGGETIFTFDLRYSVVNVNGDNGLGEVISKNILLTTDATEKLAATHHLNCTDIWVATHGRSNNQFYSYLVTKEGVIHCPVTSEVGSVMAAANNQTEMRFSPSGELACVSFFSDGFVELFKFDKKLGTFTDPIKIETNPGWVTGVAFSNNDKKLFLAARWSWIRCYNLDTLSKKSIEESEITLYTDTTNSVNSQFSNTKHNTVVFNWAGKDYLGGIIMNDHDSLISFVDSFVAIAPRMATYGMPQFISSYFYKPDLEFTYKYHCEHDSVFFEAQSSGNLTLPSWSIFKNSISVFSSTGKAFGFNFLDTGEYLVRLISGNDTIAKTVFIEPPFNLEDTVLCNQSSFEISIPEGYRCIQWQDGSDTNHYLMTESGKYYVRAYHREGCRLSDTIRLQFSTIPKPVISRRGDSLFTDSGVYSYSWLRNGTVVLGNGAAIKISQTGNYRIDITDTIGCSNVSENFPVSSLGVQRIDADNYFKVYPVPAGDKLYIESKEDIQIENISLTDITGRNSNYEPVSVLPVDDLSPGTYFLTINNLYRFKIMIH